MSRGCLFLALLFLTAPCQAERVVIAAEDAWTPYANADGTGMANDIITAAFAAVDVSVDYHIYPYARVLHYLDTGAYVAGFNVPIDAISKEKYLLGSTPLYKAYSAYYHNTQRALKITNRAQFNGELVGIVRGYGYGDQFLALVAEHKVVAAYANSDLPNMRRLMLGRLDSALIFIKSANYLRRTQGISDNIQVAFINEGTDIFLAFSPHHPDGERLQKLFEQGLKKIIENGARDAILARY
ncbi:transporter substrate-binding domain-containing protein [Pseudoalteromonas sp. CO325X]|uniref:substrate-binding periplasmic protein n=1 Tax=Pseudoalteromonas sp. CO325X TaxID=1777262 RepID=UPI001023724D|nr:transporter substrate-binding domain-containing protein [Pseudoalteromonas sp. CO325X]RZF85511.1 transporter substrate-binding domain-containing protein [Pseudoalteromonas sp. CO325X]